MKKYEAVIILNPNLSSKVDSFIKDFEKLLKANTFNIKKMEDIGRRQLSYSINNHNKGHYLIDDRLTHNGANEFEGEKIHFGSEDYPDWNSVTSYLMKKDT